ncbi:Guanine nucleotide-binding protein G(I)/G(S)/G(T) subunit beta-1 [Phytophthora oleae]|uniref:Guanine nucleotide-binding protein G(I)/G(S)/G(T) subunit beta-1 n=1 Tax=Phytophthora oleae TaxID=2107226 RepID=A0ABD3FTU6_9STRA
MKAKTTAHARQRLPLRGYERTLTMVDGVSNKDRSLKARSRPTLIVRVLLPVGHHVVSVTRKGRNHPITNQSEGSDVLTREWWVDFGYERLAFELKRTHSRVQVEDVLNRVSVADGYSGMAVLNGILEQIAILANGEEPERETPPNEWQNLPLRPSLYKMILSKATWAKLILKSAVKVSGRQPLVTRGGHESDINLVDFFPSGNDLGTGSDDSSCRRFDLGAYGELNNFTSASFSKFDRFLFVGYDYYNCYCWDVLSTTGAHTYQLVAHENRVSCLGVNTGQWPQAAGTPLKISGECLPNTVWSLANGQQVVGKQGRKRPR